MNTNHPIHSPRKGVNAWALLALVALAAIHAALSTALGQSTAFTYQGQLFQDGRPHNGPAELRFTLFHTPTSGFPAGRAEDASVDVTNGVFTVPLDFGLAAFSGGDRWLEIQVRVAGEFSRLSPRQKITPTPYALTARQLTGVLPSSGLTGSYSSAVSFINPGNTFRGDGAGLDNVNAATLGGLSGSDFWSTSGNSGTIAGTHFLGTTDNQPLEFKVNGMRALRLENTFGAFPIPNNQGAPNVIGGSPSNAAPLTVGATIAGGGAANYGGISRPNIVKGAFGTIGGGLQNKIIADWGTIAGGRENLIGDENEYATISGGFGNFIDFDADAATIPGGMSNSIGANANFSFAAGCRAKANHQGTFVWSDGNGGVFSSTASNQFLIRAAGGVGIGTASPQAALQVSGNNSQLRLHDTGRGNFWSVFTENHPNAAISGNLLFVPGPTGVSAFIQKSTGNYFSSSDVRLKEEIRSLSGMLDRVLRLRPVSYRFKSAPATAPRTLGLIAQEVEPLFPEVVSERDGMKSLAYAELVPVALGAVQELHQKVEERTTRLEQELKRRDAENAELKRRLEQLVARVNALAQSSNGGDR